MTYEPVRVTLDGELAEVHICNRCEGTGHQMDWNRKEQKHELNPRYKCEYCHGARYIIVPMIPTEYKEV